MWLLIYISGFILTYIVLRHYKRTRRTKENPYTWRDFKEVLGFALMSWVGIISALMILLLIQIVFILARFKEKYFNNKENPPTWL